jgi:endonuclease/exonuclease/phosphatase family metal-dependent hydrolase
MGSGPASRSRWFVALAVCALVPGCRTGRNYEGVAGPRYADRPPATAGDGAAVDILRLVSFNIERSLRVDTAIAVIAGDPETRGADIILLQEMDEAGARRVAVAFGMAYVYYPATFSLKTQRDFGNAVLSRWPIVEDSKVLLPHLGVVGRLRRTATGATVRVGGSLIRVYSTHLGTLINATPEAQRAQLRTVFADAERYPNVVVGGDMNSHGVGRLARARGYAWPTEHGPRTTRFGRWDHIFFRGFASPARADAGTVLDVRGASDHRAVWAVVKLR